MDSRFDSSRETAKVMLSPGFLCYCIFLFALFLLCCVKTPSPGDEWMDLYFSPLVSAAFIQRSAGQTVGLVGKQNLEHGIQTQSGRRLAGL